MVRVTSGMRDRFRFVVHHKDVADTEKTLYFSPRRRARKVKQLGTLYDRPESVGSRRMQSSPRVGALRRDIDDTVESKNLGFTHRLTV